MSQVENSRWFRDAIWHKSFGPLFADQSFTGQNKSKSAESNY